MFHLSSKIKIFIYSFTPDICSYHTYRFSPLLFCFRVNQCEIHVNRHSSVNKYVIYLLRHLSMFINYLFCMNLWYFNFYNTKSFYCFTFIHDIISFSRLIRPNVKYVVKCNLVCYCINGKIWIKINWCIMAES